ncbi:MAG TPA: hypothetical protein DIW23_13530 [Anaerolineae bacterium]|nr:hypothetical protein [Anaerolineae bacterium]
MENNEPKGNLGQFLLKILAGTIGLGVLAFLLYLIFDLQVGFALFLVSILTTLIGSYLRAPSIALRRIDMLITNKPNEVREKHASDVQASQVPTYGTQNLLFFSGLLGLLFSLPYICGLMFS